MTAPLYVRLGQSEGMAKIVDHVIKCRVQRPQTLQRQGRA